VSQLLGIPMSILVQVTRLKVIVISPTLAIDCELDQASVGSVITSFPTQ
jgi:hypothetical protein